MSLTSVEIHKAPEDFLQPALLIAGAAEIEWSACYHFSRIHDVETAKGRFDILGVEERDDSHIR